VVGQSNGAADQVMPLPARSVDPATFVLQVEESGRGYQTWRRVDDLALQRRDDAVYRLDSEAGSVSFGNGINGRIPEIGRRVRVESMRAGGGSAGNLPHSSLAKITARDLNGNLVERKLTLTQGLATEGGEDAEDLVTAERRIPARLRHRNRCVTEVDYKALVMETPGVKTGRIEVLPRFMPHQRRNNVPGVVSVMVLPAKALTEAPNPRPDQPFIEKIYAYLDNRRPLATELYVIGCEYIQIGLSVGITVNDGSAYDQVVNDVRESLKHYLWSLAPHGPNSAGWPLGKSVKDRELEVAVARVPGVNGVNGVNIFKRDYSAWKRLERTQASDGVELPLENWQLPELLAVVVSTDGSVSTDLRASPVPFDGDTSGGIAVPIVPEVC
jgi:predicted phage baseplate assembly protein